MALWFSISLVAWPLLEIVALVWLSEKIGLPLTLASVGAGFAVGILVLRRTGLHAVRDLRGAMERGVEPGHSLIDAACFASAGLLLIVPGPLSDILAGALMLPATRNYLLRFVARRFEGKFSARKTVIEGTFEVVNERESEDRGGDGRRVPGSGVHRP